MILRDGYYRCLHHHCEWAGLEHRSMLWENTDALKMCSQYHPFFAEWNRLVVMDTYNYGPVPRDVFGADLAHRATTFSYVPVCTWTEQDMPSDIERIAEYYRDHPKFKLTAFEEDHPINRGLHPDERRPIWHEVDYLAGARFIQGPDIEPAAEVLAVVAQALIHGQIMPSWENVLITDAVKIIVIEYREQRHDVMCSLFYAPDAGLPAGPHRRTCECDIVPVTRVRVLGLRLKWPIPAFQTRRTDENAQKNVQRRLCCPTYHKRSASQAMKWTSRPPKHFKPSSPSSSS
jgi:hypothetical protein